MFSLFLTSDSISESRGRNANVFSSSCLVYGSALWIEAEADPEPTTQMRQAKPSPLDSCLARHIFSKQKLVFIHEEI